MLNREPFERISFSYNIFSISWGTFHLLPVPTPLALNWKWFVYLMLTKPTTVANEIQVNQIIFMIEVPHQGLFSTINYSEKNNVLNGILFSISSLRAFGNCKLCDYWNWILILHLAVTNFGTCNGLFSDVLSIIRHISYLWEY